jgi:hypothetical protein
LWLGLQVLFDVGERTRRVREVERKDVKEGRKQD